MCPLSCLFKKKKAADYKSLLQKGATIVDVRTAEEYKNGHIAGSINIPLPFLTKEALALLPGNQPVITCCMSGARSGMATLLLQKNGFTAYNGGAWTDLQQKII